MSGRHPWEELAAPVRERIEARLRAAEGADAVDVQSAEETGRERILDLALWPWLALGLAIGAIAGAWAYCAQEAPWALQALISLLF